MIWRQVFRRGTELNRLKSSFQKVPKPIFLVLFILVGIPAHVIRGMYRGAKSGYSLALQELNAIYRMC